MERKQNTKNIPNDENSIDSVLSLVNEELAQKDEIIKKLKKNKNIDFADLSDIKNFSKEKLKEYKDFYLNKLKLINNALEKK